MARFGVALVLGLVLVLGGCRCVEPEIPVCVATTPVSRLDVGWWAARLAEKEAQAKAPHETVFIGDSITHNWDVLAPDLQRQHFGAVLNLGFSGDRTQHVLWRIARIDWSVVAPKRIQLMIGTNNSGAAEPNPPEETFYGISAIVRELRRQCPEAKITLLAIFPRAKDSQDVMRARNNAINRMLPSLADNEYVFYRDISALYLLPDGDTLNVELLPDWLHPNKAGYHLWAAAIAPEMLRDYQ